MSFSPLINELIEALRCLPGVGPKTAQRMAFALLHRERDRAKHLAQKLTQAIERIQHCQRCRTFCEETLCAICQNPRRDPARLCIVELPADILALENTGVFRGYYFVLLGHLSPLDGIGPTELGVPKLLDNLQHLVPNEIIIATNSTVEGEATAHYLTELIRKRHAQIKLTRIAHGIPVGGELEYLDGNTLARALAARTLVVHDE